MSIRGAGEQTPLLRSNGIQENVNNQTARELPDALLDEQQTKLAQAEAEAIKATLPRSMVIPSLVSLWACLCIAAIDGTLVIALISSISSSFGASDRVFWLSTAFMLTMCAFAPVYGRLSDILGRKVCLLLAVSVFALGTLMCTMAPTMEFLIFARAIQGIGAGGIQPCVAVVMNDLITLRQRGMYNAISQVVFSVGNALGGPLGGLLNDRIGWRFAFTIQLPPILLAVTMLSFYLQVPDLPKTPAEQRTLDKCVGKSLISIVRQRLDMSGAVFLIGAVMTLLLALSFVIVQDALWSNPLVLGLLCAALVLSMSFLYIEAYIADEPLLPMRLVNHRTLVSTWLLYFVYCVAAAIIYYFPFYFIAVLQQSATQTGIHFLAISISTTSGSFFAGSVMKRSGRYYWMNITCAGLAVITPFWLASWSNTNRPTTFAQNVVMAPMGFGTAGSFTILLISALATVERQDQAATIGLIYLFRSLGVIVGVALGGSQIQKVLAHELAKRIHGPNAVKIINDIRKNIDIVKLLPPSEKQAAEQSYAAALRVFHLSAGILATVCFFLCFFIQEKSLDETNESIESNQDREEQ